ncbi:dTDP-glucose 4,6-dehydratase [Caulobacter sp. CCUG 60055]|uniref:dTDP-glucose 4,6-dehydratase n=1 Tax=Caulobacter sp. CCUG 60055 TaxID=2100090 RepID=UPI001FA781D4|nr:dTDP-glucose 4,6-dehydratase [Caulobacter sp. CCUG 60055]MCI3181577.1 dTDP-glucose 4,6-dehydratase [Caulobacter sp. CCUG 60055]
MKIFVTGGAGFIGSAFCRQIHAETGASIVNLDAMTYAAAAGSLRELDGDDRYALVRGDIVDRAVVAEIFAELRPDAVVHFAAESHVDRSIARAADFIRTNVVGTQVMLDAALNYWRGLGMPSRGRFRFVHVSTDEVFGSLGREGRFNETTAYDPSSPYSASKAASDLLVRAWGRTYGLPVVISNCSNNYGSHQFPEKLIPLMILSALEGRPLPVYGDGRQIRDWLHVDDHVRALRAILERGRPGETYCVGGEAERTNLQVVEAICDLVDEMRPGNRSRRELITHVQDRPGHDRRYAIDASKLKQELGWSPRHTFEEGLRETVSWYLANQDWWLPLRGLYAGNRLGLIG